jgi:SAM-dependent methyltransferase
MEWALDAFYDDYPRVEEAFARTLDQSLAPRGPDVVYEVAEALGLPSTATVVDAGCGEGRDVVALHDRFGWSVVGIDPVARHLELTREAAGPLPLAAGRLEALPLADRSVDLVWCREVLSHVPALEAAFTEVHRVLRPGGRALVAQVCRTEHLGADEATGVLAFLGRHPPADEVDAAVAAAGLVVDEHIVLGSEGGEWAEERSGAGTRRLLHAARLLRDPDRYVAEFGRSAYEIMLGDCLWHVYRMIGKLSGSLRVLSRQGQRHGPGKAREKARPSSASPP